MSTVINAPIDLQHICQIIDGFLGILEWSVDLEDSDKILRVVSNNDIGPELVKSLARVGVSSSVMEVFDENGLSLGAGLSFVH
ncbi:hypothetical protein [Pedobacter sp. B4-66]|uniref:hypothetical protein n=1 Tax=Pedobacter sp. B4-66 TaxID=2817280 RepID=UPI001BDA85FB|nr:hypothetical protein [Pedobacter sp. B4-66]